MAELFLDWPMVTRPPHPTFPCFRDQAMAQWECDASAYERRVFWRVLPRVALPLAAIVWLVNRAFFARDLALIRELGPTRDATEYHFLIAQFRDDCLRSGGWLRNVLRLRVSSRRLRRLRWDLR